MSDNSFKSKPFNKFLKSDARVDAQFSTPRQFSRKINISELGGHGTSGTMDNISRYLRTLPSDFDIFREVSLSIDAIPDEYVRKMTSHFIFLFQRIIMNNRSNIESLGSLPPLKFRPLNEDSSVLIEWIFPDFRIGFSIEKEEKESSWYLVSNQKLDEFSSSGQLNMSDVEPLIYSLINFVRNNK